MLKDINLMKELNMWWMIITVGLQIMDILEILLEVIFSLNDSAFNIIVYYISIIIFLNKNYIIYIKIK